jgi:hypothetical protein
MLAKYVNGTTVYSRMNINFKNAMQCKLEGAQFNERMIFILTGCSMKACYICLRVPQTFLV